MEVTKELSAFGAVVLGKEAEVVLEPGALM